MNLDAKLGLAWNLLGLSEFETRNYKASWQHLQRAQEVGLGDNPDADKVAKYHIALLLNLNGEFEKATGLLTAAFGRDHLPEQIKTALGIGLLRIPLLPQQIDPSKDALVHAAGEVAALLAAQHGEEALPLFEQMLEDYPDAHYLHYAYGSALLSLGRTGPGGGAVSGRDTRQPEECAAPYAPRGNGDGSEASEGRAVIRRECGEARAAMGAGPRDAGQGPAALRKYSSGDCGTGRGQEVFIRTRCGCRLGSGICAGWHFRPAQHRAFCRRRPGREGCSRERRRCTRAGAIRDYQAETRRRPDWEEGWQQLGTLLYATGKHPEAVAAFKSLVQLNPTLGSAWALLGVSEFETKDYKNALIHLRRGQELGLTGNAAAMQTARYHLALLLDLDGEFDQAMDLLVPEIAPGPFQQQVRQAMGLALLRMPTLPDQVPPDRQELVRSAGEAAALLAESRYDQAFPILKQILGYRPGHPVRAFRQWFGTGFAFAV